MSTGAISTIFRSLSSTPLGQGDGEQKLLRPYNDGPRTVTTYARNWSALKKRRVVREAISWRRGGEKSVAKGGPLSNGTSIQQLREEARNGMDMNWYAEEVKETDARLLFDGRAWVIPARGQDGEPAPKTQIPEGLMDLYCGNYERMNSDDPLVRSEEIAKLRARVREIFCLGPDDDEHPNGFIEFIREEIEFTARPASEDHVYAEGMTTEV